MDVHTQAVERNGQQYGWLTLAVDITERKKMEETLRVSDAALKSIQECVYVVDNEYNVTFWNETCERIFGMKASDVLGKPIVGLYELLEEYPGQNEERRKLLRGRGYNRAEERFRTKTGEYWMDVHT